MKREIRRIDGFNGRLDEIERDCVKKEDCKDVHEGIQQLLGEGDETMGNLFDRIDDIGKAVDKGFRRVAYVQAVTAKTTAQMCRAQGNVDCEEINKLVDKLDEQLMEGD